NITIFNQDDIQYGTKELNRSTLSGFSYNFGAAYKKMITEKLELHSGATFGVESNLNSENFRQLSSVLVLNEDIQAEIDIMEVDVADTKLTMPTQYSFGLGIGEPRKWFAGAEYFSQQKNNYINRTFTLANVEAKNASAVKLGGFYIPD